jgi:hypothetical protein
MDRISENVTTEDKIRPGKNLDKGIGSRYDCLLPWYLLRVVEGSFP